LHADLDSIKKYSRIISEANTNAVSRTADSHSIYFIPSNDDEKDEFIHLLFSGLLLRSLSVEEYLEELHQRLLSALVEEKYRDNMNKLSHCSALEASIIALLHKVLCVLHAKNRIGIKIFLMVLMEGFSNALEKLLYPMIGSAIERIKAYAERSEQISNREILGDDDGPVQWSVPMHENGKTVGAITLDNNRICQVLEHLAIIIDASIVDVDRRNKYYNCIPKYCDAMQIVRQKEEFTDDDIINYQNLVDNWFQVWVQLHSDAGCTNYIHLLSSGHLAKEMFKWRNLYRFSQQGFEKINHVFSTFYFRRTNHGGRRHRVAQKSKLLAIGRWLHRRLLWMTGETDKL
jgi:hypothetical protein